MEDVSARDVGNVVSLCTLEEEGSGKFGEKERQCPTTEFLKVFCVT